MTSSEFWDIVDDSRQGCGLLSDFSYARQRRRLRASLRQLSLPEIASFDSIFWQRRIETYRNDLAGAAYVIGEASGDDCFDLFRIGLISLGRNVYEAAPADVENLVDIPEVDQMPEWYGEREAMGFVGIANEVYRDLVAGKDIPRSGRSHPRELIGPRWRFDDLPHLFPKLWAKYGHQHEIS